MTDQARDRALELAVALITGPRVDTGIHKRSGT